MDENGQMLAISTPPSERPDQTSAASWASCAGVRELPSKRPWYNKWSMWCCWLGLILIPIGCTTQSSTNTAPKADEVTLAEQKQIQDRLLRSYLDGLAGGELLDQTVTQRESYITGLQRVEDFLQKNYPNRTDLYPALENQRAQELVTQLGSLAVLNAQNLQFSPIDSLFVENVFFCKRIVDRFTPLSEPFRLEALFEWLTLQIQSIPDDQLALGRPVDVLFRGRGTVAERCWAFADLCQQANQDCWVLAVPASSKQSETNPSQWLPWLLAVRQAQQLLVFDPYLGVPIRNGAGQIAHLQELQADLGLLRRLLPNDADLLAAYPIALAEFPQTLALLQPLPVEMLAPRMRYLQEKFAGTHAIQFYVDFSQRQQEMQQLLETWQIPAQLGVWRTPSTILESMAQQLRSSQEPAAWNYGALRYIEDLARVRTAILAGLDEQPVQELVQQERRISPAQLDLWGATAGPNVALQQQVFAQTRQLIPYLLAQSNLNFTPPRYRVAANWFERYLRQNTATQLTGDQLLRWQPLCRQLLAQAKQSDHGPASRIWELLSAAERDFLRQAEAKFDQLTELRSTVYQNEQLLAENNKSISDLGIQRNYDDLQKLKLFETQLENARRTLNQIEKDDYLARNRLVQKLNELLHQRDFYQPEYFADVVAKLPMDSALQQRLQQQPTSWSAEQIYEINFGLIERAFPNTFGTSGADWRANSFRWQYLCQYRQAKPDQDDLRRQAIQQLKSLPSFLPPTNRLECYATGVMLSSLP